MSFKYSVIGDNSQENREWLEKVGINRPPYTENLGNVILVYTDDDNNQRYETADSIYDFADTDLSKVINCIGNPPLFKAVSAMREDSDYLQWFMCKTSRFTQAWYLCEEDNYIQWAKKQKSFLNSLVLARKATLSELQERFKLK